MDNEDSRLTIGKQILAFLCITDIAFGIAMGLSRISYSDFILSSIIGTLFGLGFSIALLSLFFSKSLRARNTIRIFCLIQGVITGFDLIMFLFAYATTPVEFTSIAFVAKPWAYGLYTAAYIAQNLNRVLRALFLIFSKSVKEYIQST